MPCHAITYAMPCHAMPCHAMPCHTIPYHTISFFQCNQRSFTIKFLFDFLFPYQTPNHLCFNLRRKDQLLAERGRSSRGFRTSGLSSTVPMKILATCNRVARACAVGGSRTNCLKENIASGWLELTMLGTEGIRWTTSGLLVNKKINIDYVMEAAKMLNFGRWSRFRIRVWIRHSHCMTSASIIARVIATLNWVRQFANQKANVL